MLHRTHNREYSGMKTSPWIILGSTVILLVVVIILAVQNTNRDKRYMSKILREKGAALIRAVEAGARTGMTAMMWGGAQIQRLLEETAKLPDVLYMVVVDPDGQAVAHSDSSKINTPFHPGHKLIHLGPDREENWELASYGKQAKAFEVHRRFEPLKLGIGRNLNHMRAMMHWHGDVPVAPDDWYRQIDNKQFLIVVGLDVTPFEEAIREDFQTTVVLSVVLILSGFGGFVSLFWMNNYRTAKQHLQDTSAFANEVVTHLPVGLIATDRAGKITFFNPAVEKISGIPSSMAKGRSPDSILPAQLCGLKQDLDRGKTITDREMECVFADGRPVPVSASATHIVNEVGKFVGQILILRDLEEVRRLQGEIRRQEKMAALGGLAAGVAHEIRNPLSSIKGLATFFAAQFEDGSESKRAASIMIQEVDRLNRVITELLDFSRPTDLKFAVKDLSPIVKRSIQLIEQETARLGVQMDLHIAKDICPVMIDADRIAQCLLNIYLNAIQAMEHGGRLTVSCDAVERRFARIVISDTGLGIKAEHLNRIFDPYFTTKAKGTGLGLAIVHKIIEAHQARVEVESLPGKGTTFTIRFACQDICNEEKSP